MMTGEAYGVILLEHCLQCYDAGSRAGHCTRLAFTCCCVEDVVGDGFVSVTLAKSVTTALKTSCVSAFQVNVITNVKRLCRPDNVCTNALQAPGVH